MGTAGADALYGNSLADSLQGLDGNDTLVGFGGNDTLDAGAGDDSLDGGSGDDTLLAGDGNDSLNAGDGNDTLTAGAGNDSLYGGAGDDTLSGGAGNDYMNGGDGNDVYLFGRGAGQDTIAEYSWSATDSIQMAADVLPADVTLLRQGNDLVLGIAGTTDTLTMQNWFAYQIYQVEQVKFADGTMIALSDLQFGTTVDDTLTGTNADSVLMGYDGNDTLIGNGGNDFMKGGAGDDVYIVDSVGDLAIEIADEGIDLVQSTVSQVLAANVENLTLSGTDAINGTGNTLDNLLIGNATDNVLDGGAGADTLQGEGGNDVYVIDNEGDITVENFDDGIDLVRSTVSHTLAANVENLTLSGTDAINGTGNSLNNTLMGNSANNVLDGGAGADTLQGGEGNDVYLLDSVGDVVIENANEGTDLVQSTVSQTLAANVENLTLVGTDAINGTGNSLNNTLIGNSASNVLDGGAGSDTMTGGNGSDSYFVDNLGDIVTETNASASTGGIDLVNSSLGAYTLGSNVENGRILATGAANLTGNALNNVLYAGAGNNVLNGSTGIDTADYSYAGSAVTASLAIATAQATGGSGSDTLTAIENLTGSNFNDKLTGNTSANVLNGGLGADTMIGGDGADTYYVDNTGDKVTESNATASTGGIDTVNSSLAAYTLGSNVENGRILLTGAANLTGNSLNNVLYASTGNNVLNGSTGTDTADYSAAGSAVTVSLAITAAQATGGSGSDTLTAIENLTGSNFNDKLTGNTGNNLLIGGAGQDTLTGGAGNDVFDFNAIAETGLTSSTWDVITDFVRGQDKIDLSTMDANAATTASNEAFAFIGATAFSTTNATGQLRYVYDSVSATGMLYGSTNADSAAEFAIKLTGVSTLAATDFVL